MNNTGMFMRFWIVNKTNFFIYKNKENSKNGCDKKSKKKRNNHYSIICKVCNVKINDKIVISSVVILIMRETRGIFSYKLLRKSKFMTRKIRVIHEERKISILLPSLSSPQGSWLKSGTYKGKEK